MMRNLFLLLLLPALGFTNCKKEIITEIQTITVHDTVTIPGMLSDTFTSFIIVRHAEKEGTGANPNLTAEGIERANELVKVLTSVSLNKVYSTPFNRTKQTAQPISTAKSLATTEYSATTSAATLIKQFIAENKGKTSLIVGHSNTVPDLLKAFTDNKFTISIADNQYDNLFIVSLPDGQPPRVMHLKFGKTTP